LNELSIKTPQDSLWNEENFCSEMSKLGS